MDNIIKLEHLLEIRRRVIEKAGYPRKTFEDYLRENKYEEAAEVFFREGTKKLVLQASNPKLDILEHKQTLGVVKTRSTDELSFFLRLQNLCQETGIEFRYSEIENTKEAEYCLYVPREDLQKIWNEFSDRAIDQNTKISTR
ncbi:MAG: hypothetical protein ACOXZS_04505 [Bacilli bacterium]